MFRICFIIVLLISLAIPFQVNAKSMNFETLLKDLPVPQSSVIEIGFGVFNNKNEEFAFACANKDTELGKEGKIYIKKIKTGEKWKLFNSDEGITNAKIVDVDSDGIVEILVIRQGGMGNIMTVEIIREKDIYYFPKSFKNGVAEIIVNSGQLDKIVINHEINLPVPPPRYGLASFLKYNNKKAEIESKTILFAFILDITSLTIPPPDSKNLSTCSGE